MLIFNSKDQILHMHNAGVRGMLNYYSFVHNYGKIAGFINHIMKGACACLLAAKFKLKSQRKVYQKFGQDLQGSDKVAFVKVDYKVFVWSFMKNPKDIAQSLYSVSKSIASLNTLAYLACGSTYRVEKHHIRKMADLNPQARFVDKLMAKHKRKQIPLCQSCYMAHHTSRRLLQRN